MGYTDGLELIIPVDCVGLRLRILGFLLSILKAKYYTKSGCFKKVTNILIKPKVLNIDRYQYVDGKYNEGKRSNKNVESTFR